MADERSILYLGTDPSRYPYRVTHLPLIATRPLPLPDSITQEFAAFTHIIVTSRITAAMLISRFSFIESQKTLLAIGQGTAEVFNKRGIACHGIASPETQEGMIHLLHDLSIKESYVFYPRSAAARPILATFLAEQGFRHQICDLYETVYLKPDPLPSLEPFEEIVFTSPSTVKAFIALYEKIPLGKKITSLGPITQQFISKIMTNYDIV